MEKEILKFKELTQKIIGCSFNVYNKLGFGYLESVYENCMMIELFKCGLNSENQKPIIIYYDEFIVGEFFADILVENEIILELKSIRSLNIMHEIQLVNYLTSIRKDVGLLINFGEKKVEIKRKVRSLSEYGIHE